MVTPTNRTSRKTVTRMIRNVVIFASRPKRPSAKTAPRRGHDVPAGSTSLPLLVKLLSLVVHLLPRRRRPERSEEHTSELQSLMRISYAVFCLTKKKRPKTIHKHQQINKTTTK